MRKIICNFCGSESVVKDDKKIKLCDICRKIKAYTRYRIRHREKYLQQSRKGYWKNREQRIKWTVESNKKLRQERRKIVLEHYGGTPPKCECCGEKIIQFLTLEHLNGGGRKHRRSLNSKTSGIWGWVIKNNFPKEFSILCMNCNFGKYKNKNICPHQSIL